MRLHGDIGVDINPQITNGSSGSDVVVADPGWRLGYQMLSSIRGAPENIRLCGVELQTIALHPQCDFIDTRRHLHLKLGGIWR